MLEIDKWIDAVGRLIDKFRDWTSTKAISVERAEQEKQKTEQEKQKTEQEKLKTKHLQMETKLEEITLTKQCRDILRQDASHEETPSTVVTLTYEIADTKRLEERSND